MLFSAPIKIARCISFDRFRKNPQVHPLRNLATVTFALCVGCCFFSRSGDRGVTSSCVELGVIDTSANLISLLDSNMTYRRS